MRPQLQQRLHHAYVRQAEAWLEQPARAIDLTWPLQHRLTSHIRSAQLRGLDDQEPLLRWTGFPRGKVLLFGMLRYRIATRWGEVDLIHVQAPCAPGADCDLFNFWVTPRAHYWYLYRHIRRISRDEHVAPAPILPESQRESLWANTIAFLTEHRQLLEQYDIVRNRGVLLLGEPGNGKTTACRWLRSECLRRNLHWRDVSLADYQQSKANGTTASLFQLEGPGIILFDDFHDALRVREAHTPQEDLTTFLTAMDGIDHRGSSVFLFTSNAHESEFDPAFLRPGRIDVILRFDRPDAAIRRVYIQHRWPAPANCALPLDQVIRQTEGLSFAELEELRKCLVVHFAERQAWDWEAVWLRFQQQRGTVRSTRPLGFQMEPREFASPYSVSAQRNPLIFTGQNEGSDQNNNTPAGV